jgi:AraC-like DNA-binding protein
MPMTAMSTVISTDDLPPVERLDFAREVLSQALTVPLEIQPLTEETFHLELRYRDLGAARMSLAAATAFRVRRTPVLIRRSDPDLLCIGLCLRGDGTFDQHGRQVRAPRFDPVLWDTSRPYGAWTGPRTGTMQFLIMEFPRALLPMPAAQLEQLMAVKLPADNGAGALASQLLTRLATDMDHYTPGEAARLSTAALDVLAVTLARALDGDRWVPPETHQHALLVRIHAFIQQHLGDPELSPSSIAAAHHITPRYLHMLFQNEGATVATWIRQRRLEHSRHELSDPASASPVAQIAARWGFSSASHFSTVFKAAYGMPPQEYRRQVLSGCRDTVRGS